MQPEDNIAILRQAIQFINDGEMVRVAEFITPEFKRHDLAGMFPAKKSGSAEAINFLGTLRTAFPDLRFDIQDVFACNDRIAMRFLISGTHKADLFGASPTGLRVVFSGINIYRFEGDKIAEVWQLWDWAAVLSQIGILNFR